MTDRLSELSPDTYSAHPIHSGDRVWIETNCSVDVWVELLHAAGLNPAAALGFTVDADFDGSQWSFVKYSIEDLRTIYGIDVAELNVWRPVVEHIEEQLERGNLLTVEVDSFFLPDTAGVSYQLEHVKTTVVVVMLDRAGRRMHYLHGRGLFAALDSDFDGLFPVEAAPGYLPPYVELVKFPTAPDAQLDGELVMAAARQHLMRQPTDEPARRLADALVADVDWLLSAGNDGFHRWAFGTIRQFGATAELAADYSALLAALGCTGAAAEPMFRETAELARSVQLMLARAARGRSVDIKATAHQLADLWQGAIRDLAAGIG